MCSVLRELAQEYPQINCAVVLESMPGKLKPDYPEDFSDTILPESIEEVPPRFAISWRNNWMLAHSDYVVAYVAHSWAVLPVRRNGRASEENDDKLGVIIPNGCRLKTTSKHSILFK